MYGAGSSGAPANGASSGASSGRAAVRIRPAVPDDAPEACVVMRRSITELCGADHMDDPVVLGAWLANKSPQTVSSWIAAPHRHLVVAVAADGSIAGVGMANASGEIALNYVSPDARFSGVSHAVMRALEDWLRDLGHDRSSLVSTETAFRFYAALGYRPDGPAKPVFGAASSQPMVKDL